MIPPCADGSRPSPDSRIAFSTILIWPLSNGVTMMTRGSGALIVATWLSGISCPYVSTLNGVEHARRCLARAHGRELVFDMGDVFVHRRAGVFEDLLNRAHRTRVPMRSPRTAATIAPGRWMLRTISGSEFSRHNVIAVWSITLSSFHDDVAEADLVVQTWRSDRVFGIGRVDAFDARRLDDDVRFDLNGAQHRGRVGGKVRIARAGGKDDGAAFLEMSNRAAPNVRLGDLLHADRRHDAGVDALPLEDVLHGQRVDHRAEHAHVVGGDAVHASLRKQRAADDVAAADHESDRRPGLDDGDDFVGDPADGVEVVAESLVSGEGFAGELEQDARILQRRSR